MASGSPTGYDQRKEFHARHNIVADIFVLLIAQPHLFATRRSGFLETSLKRHIEDVQLFGKVNTVITKGWEQFMNFVKRTV